MKTIRFIASLSGLVWHLLIPPATAAEPYPAATDTAETVREYRIAFYNVENLFYPTRDTGILDEDYTPAGARHWSWAKYETKCHRIFKVIAALDAEKPLLCIGLAEVENGNVLRQLCYGTPLRQDRYRYVHFDSPDRRGIDVALLYRADRMSILNAYPVTVGQDSGTTAFRTRDILAVQARIHATNDTLYLFVVHFPSKFGGTLATDGRRRQAGCKLRLSMDSAAARHPQARILAMGDFNAAADEAALKESIGYTTVDAPAASPYINLMTGFPPDVGSHKYRERWSLIDHILVNRPLLESCRPQTERPVAVNKRGGRHTERWPRPRYAAIFHRDFLLTEDKTYFGEKPFRTFVGPVYHGGFSYHLPVYIDVVWPSNPSEP
ncbi:MAG: endonuclease/exonuclease/phosphatase family protein [Bacteroidales bacterium]|nr:endonuclease/exonuclease/phosphatase family protein [Bacteroidales bacterium]